MYFLFNKEDNSYNCHSENNFPDFMISDDVYEIELSQEHVDSVPEDSITFTHYNQEDDVLYVKEEMVYGETSKGKIDLENTLNSLLLVPEDERPPEYNTILMLCRVHLGLKKVEEIQKEHLLTDEDALNILNYLDNA